MMTLLRTLLVSVLLAPISGAFAQDQADLWEALRRGGHALLIRHALAPGTGDPAGFQVDDCATQRNLSEEGRQQARQLGKLLRDQGLKGNPVYSSQWCRCLDTARLLDLKEVEPFRGLNSFFRHRAREPEQTREVLALLQAHRQGPSPVLVTHQVNITALTGVFPRSGEMVVVRLTGEGLEVLGRIDPP